VNGKTLLVVTFKNGIVQASKKHNTFTKSKELQLSLLSDFPFLLVIASLAGHLSYPLWLRKGTNNPGQSSYCFLPMSGQCSARLGNLPPS